MSRAPCLGECPVYDIEIKGDGSVTYSGWKFVEVLGTRTTQISQEQIGQLVADFNALNFLELATPQHTIFDCPITVLSLTLDGRNNSYSDYQVCGFENTLFDEKILYLEQRIDEVSNSQRWLGDAAMEILESFKP